MKNSSAPVSNMNISIFYILDRMNVLVHDEMIIVCDRMCIVKYILCVCVRPS